MKKSKWILLALVLVLGLTVSACALRDFDTKNAADQAKEEAGESEVNDTPDANDEPVESANETESESETNQIIVYDFNGEAVDLTADGKPVYVKVWASWCSVCLAGMDEFETFSAEDHDYTVVSVVAPGEYGEMSEEDFIEWWNGLGYENIQVYFDRGANLFSALSIRAFPTSAYFDANGALMGTVVGHNDNATIEANMAKIK